MAKVLVFCGASAGFNPLFLEQAYATGVVLGELGFDLVYGGSKDGLMGAVANGVLSKGRAVTGVVPRFLSQREVCHEKATEMILVNTMAERKEILFSLAEVVLILPGGFGTLDELFEAITLNQLNQSQKTILVLNLYGFFDGLINWIDKLQGEGFTSKVFEPFLILHDLHGLKKFLS
jgi:uncharacterized protein (TIGR00730 family)